MHQRSPAYATPHFRWLTQLYDLPNVAPSLVQGTPTLHSRPGDARKRHGARERVLCVDTGCIKCRTLVATPSEPTQAQKTITQMQRICASRALISTRIPSDEEAKEHRQKNMGHANSGKQCTKQGDKHRAVVKVITNCTRRSRRTRTPECYGRDLRPTIGTSAPPQQEFPEHVHVKEHELHAKQVPEASAAQLSRGGRQGKAQKQPQSESMVIFS